MTTLAGHYIERYGTNCNRDPDADIMDDIAGGESLTMEFKSNIPCENRSFIKTVIAFANTRGGRILFGVDDIGTVLGLDGNLTEMMRRIELSIRTRCTPRVDHRLSAVMLEGRPVIMLEVRPTEHRPYHLRSKSEHESAYVRVGSTSVVAKGWRLRDLMMESPGSEYGGLMLTGNLLPIGTYTVESARRRLSDSSGMADLEGMGLVRRTDDGWIPTVAFRMLFDCAQTISSIVCVHLDCDGRNAEFKDRKCTGTMMEQLNSAVNFVACATHDASGGYEIPHAILFEAICNAVVHRSYCCLDPTRVSVYRDRVEVVSPGGLPRGLSPEEAMSGVRSIRNPLVHAAFERMGLSGSGGLPRLAAACAEAGIPSPELYDDGMSVRLVIRRCHPPRRVSRSTNLIGDMLAIMAADPGIQEDDIAETMRISSKDVAGLTRSAMKCDRLLIKGRGHFRRWAVMDCRCVVNRG